MKLVFCTNCNELFNLQARNKSCSCKRVQGHYLDDGIHAVVSRDAVSIGIDNNEFFLAVNRVRTESELTPYFDAWVRPNTGSLNPHTSIMDSTEME